MDAGTGLNGLKYNHLTHIPPQGEALLRLFDVYKVEVYGPLVRGERRKKEEFWLIKVHSEYGVKYHPRICLRLPAENDSATLNLTIKLAGENLKESPQTSIKINDRELEGLEKYFKKHEISPYRIGSEAMHF